MVAFAMLSGIAVIQVLHVPADDKGSERMMPLRSTIVGVVSGLISGIGPMRNQIAIPITGNTEPATRYFFTASPRQHRWQCVRTLPARTSPRRAPARR